MTGNLLRSGGLGAVLLRLCLVLTLLLAATAAHAQERGQLFATVEQGFGRLVINFPDRVDLPAYKVRYDNGVLAVEFEQPVNLVLPDVAATLPDYITVGRMDPDRKGVRFGLRSAFTINHMEAGEKLFIDIMPASWQGLPPSLPASVIAELSKRAQEAAVQAEQDRRAILAKSLNPIAQVRVGRNVTFLRLEFDWNVSTEAKYSVGEDGLPRIDFGWPVPIDLYPLKQDLPPEITGAENAVSRDGSAVTLTVAEGVQPRFYQLSDTQFVVDIDIKPEIPDLSTVKLDEVPVPAMTAPAATTAAPTTMQAPGPEQTEITPTVAAIGNTVRLTFPFERDTAAAVFRRGDIVWMVFDTPAAIRAPGEGDLLKSVASNFTVMPAGDSQIVRLDVAGSRLATLGSEGRAWVLSLGDTLLDATQPVPLERRRNEAGVFEMTADLQHPLKIHPFRDPVVGDTLQVVTAFPPARGVLRPLDYVDFDALPSIQGLVLKPATDDIHVDLAQNLVVIHSEEGLQLSTMDQTRMGDANLGSAKRQSFVDLSGLREDDPLQFQSRREELITKAAESDGAARDNARLEVAHFFIANQYAEEAIGVLDVLGADLKSDDLKKPTRLALGIANTLAYRDHEAIDILGAAAYADEPDAAMWRTIARVDDGDYAAARIDAMSAEPVIPSYPRWVQQRFLFAGTRAAVETNDYPLAQRYLGMIEFNQLDPEQVTTYQLFSGRLAEAANRTQEALDTYGQVIASDIRPTRAEAVYRTLLVLDKANQIDLAKATQTLSAEALLWRGDQLEASMEKLLAELYFRNKDYRLGFETVRQSVRYQPESPSTDDLLDQAESVFSSLFLDGAADALDPVKALALYYDFREMTPPGAKGDEMIRNLARRLVNVDLLAQAGDLLEYQIDNRLKGAAQAQVAAELAVIRIANRDPEGALRVLNRTRLAELPPTLERQRRVLEARALIDADRQDLALDLLHDVKGRDADLLRIDGFWKNKQYLDAAELLEVIYSPDDREAQLTPPARMNIIKAAVGFVLAGDRLGLARLRQKFGERMSQSPEWPIFDFVTGEVQVASTEFRKVAREVSGLDSLEAFLASYRQLYGKAGEPLPGKAAPPGQG